MQELISFGDIRLGLHFVIHAPLLIFVIFTVKRRNMFEKALFHTVTCARESQSKCCQLFLFWIIRLADII